MSDTSLDLENRIAQNRALGADVSDYFALLKPRVMSLVIFTAFVGIAVAPGEAHPFVLFIALLCIAIGAGASGALNMWYDADIDAVMERTATRPIPSGAVTPGEALAFGTILSFGSVLMLGTVVNWVAAGLLAITIGFYVFVYTMWLKRSTPQNIVIGGAAGAFPPMIGWAAVTGEVSIESILLFLVIFMWTPPHFWALALYRSGDYEKAGVPMLPVVSGGAETRKQILIYSVLLAITAMAPPFFGVGGAVYLSVALLCNIGFLTLVWKLYKTYDEKPAVKAAKRVFGFSILYLFTLFAVLLLESALGITVPVLGVL